MKTIILGVSGSIAAYKAADLTSQLVKRHHTVFAVLTENAAQFVGRAPLLIAPAMNGKMWLHAATQQNIATLKSRGAEFIGPGEGMLACGYEGLGRLWNVSEIAAKADEILLRGPD